MAKKEVLLNLLAEWVNREQEFVKNLTAAERTAAGAADNWSAKDLIAHCAFWKKQLVDEIPAVLQGSTPIEYAFDHENEQIFQEYRHSSWDKVEALAHEASHLLIAQVHKMSEADLNLPWLEDRPIWRTVISNGYSHPIVHFSEHYQHKGDMAKAAELTALLGQPLAELDDGPGWQGTVKYNAACTLSLLGDKEGAINELREALAMVPSLVEWSKQDHDLDPLRDEAAFQALYE
jgi:hypothetical protein